MANPEHLEILKQGVEVWNKWQRDNPDIIPNLIGVDLNGVNLREAYFWRANLSGAKIMEADLCGSYFRDAKLRSAYLSGSDLTGTDLSRANLWRARLNGALLSEADLTGADLTGSNLTGADLREAILWGTSLGNINLISVKGLKKVFHKGPSTIGMDTILKSKGQITKDFLRGCGLNDLEIEMTKLYKPGLDPAQVTDINYQIYELYCGGGAIYYSCFISYNNKDKIFANKVHHDLQNNGVRCWFAPEDMKIGDRVRPRIDQEIRLRDKLLVILSENSIVSEWVGDEVESAIEEEKARNRNILFPIRLDDAVMESRSDWAAKIKRRRHIGDFSGWQDDSEYQQALEQLLRDLKAPSNA